MKRMSVMMEHVVDQPLPAPTPIRGVAHVTLASAKNGLTGLSVWRQRLGAGAMTPPHRHECDEVVLCESGWGELHTAGGTQRFSAGHTLTLPAGCDHRILNVGSEPLEILGIFAATPVVTRRPTGEVIELPWAS